MPIENITFNDINMDAKTGFSIQNSSNIEFHNVTVNTELGASLKVLKVNNLIVDGLKSNKPHTNAAVIDLNKCVLMLFLYNAFPTKETVTYLKLSGDRNKKYILRKQ